MKEHIVTSEEIQIKISVVKNKVALQLISYDGTESIGGLEVLKNPKQTIVIFDTINNLKTLSEALTNSAPILENGEAVEFRVKI